MTLNQIVQADKIISSLDKLPFNISYQFFKVHKKLEPQVEFQQAKAREIYEQYPFTQDGDTLTFKSAEDKDNYIKAFEELMTMDVELEDFEKPTIIVPDNVEMNVSDINVLSNFINFE